VLETFIKLVGMIRPYIVRVKWDHIRKPKQTTASPATRTPPKKDLMRKTKALHRNYKCYIFLANLCKTTTYFKLYLVLVILGTLFGS